MKPMPEDITAEKILLATICQEGARDVALECIGHLSQEDFVHPSHKALFATLKIVLDDGNEPSFIALIDAAQRIGVLERIGKQDGLFEIINSEAEIANPMLMVDMLKSCRLRRDLMRLGETIIKRAEDEGITPAYIIEQAGARLATLATKRDRSGIKPMDFISATAMEGLEQEFSGVHVPTSWLNGWSRVNNMLGGFKPGQLIILAARPGIGKTSLALNWVLAATHYAKSAGIFSLEMASDRLWRKLVGTHAGVDIRAMLRDRDRAALAKVKDARAELDSRGIWVEDRAEITPREIMGETDGLLARSPNLGLLVVDYLGLITSGDTTRKVSESTRIGEITRAFKILASDRHIPVLLLAQMNREYEKRGPTSRPMLSDLRDSGCIEQDADVVMFIHRHPEKTETELIIAKQREGPTGTIPMDFIPELTQYREAAERQTTGYEISPELHYEPK